MTVYKHPLQAFCCLLGLRHLAFAGALVLLVVLPHLALSDTPLLPLALLAAGAASALADRSAFALVPTAFPCEDSRKAAQVLPVAGGVVVGFLALTSAATPGRFVAACVLILLVRLAISAGLGLYAYASFRDDVFPLLQKLGEGTPEFRAALRERAALKGLEHRQRQDREAAVREARNRVAAYYAAHRRELQGRFHPGWVDAEVKARIPDAATDEAAYAAASALIALFEEYRADRAARLGAIERQLNEVRAQRDAIRRSGDATSEVAREELAEQDRLERELLGALAELSPAA